jgi:hypothetical protein
MTDIITRYETKLMSKIVLTIEDYFNDIEGYIIETYFRKLASDCLERIVYAYLDQLYSKKHTLDKYTVETLQDDEEVLRDFFTKHAKKSTVQATLKILEDLRELLDAYVTDK